MAGRGAGCWESRLSGSERGWSATLDMDDILWHRQETRRQTENTNFILCLGESPAYSQGIGELPSTRQIRHAFNHETMSTAAERTHELSLPLTGPIFDIFVEVFEEKLVREGLISSDLAHLSRHEPPSTTGRTRTTHVFREAYQGYEHRVQGRAPPSEGLRGCHAGEDLALGLCRRSFLLNRRRQPAGRRLHAAHSRSPNNDKGRFGLARD